MYISIHINKKRVFFGYVALFLLTIISIILIGTKSLPVVLQSNEEYRDVPILMYHGISENPKKQSKFVITSNTFESDLKYLKENKYNTIFMKDLIDYVYNGKELPPKPIVITFDDGYYNNYLYAFPLLKKYNAKMVLSPIGRYVDEYTENGSKNPNYAHASWDDLKEMLDSGCVEIQNHTYNMHSNSGGRNGSKKKKGESIECYKNVLIEDIMKMQEEVQEHLAVKPTTFTYPFGAVSNASIEILKEMGFKATLGCENKSNKIYKGDKDTLYGLHRYIRPSGDTSETYFSKLNLN